MYLICDIIRVSTSHPRNPVAVTPGCTRLICHFSAQIVIKLRVTPRGCLERKILADQTRFVIYIFKGLLSLGLSLFKGRPSMNEEPFKIKLSMIGIRIAMYLMKFQKDNLVNSVVNNQIFIWMPKQATLPTPTHSSTFPVISFPNHR